MSILLLRLSAPLQSWGSDSRFDTRQTNREPTKSGVIGMIAAALGISREDSAEKLAALNKLNFAVRVDKEGNLLRDYHTVKSAKSSYITNRYYLADAAFLVGMESDDKQLLKRIGKALHNPVFSLFLGRRSCPPTLPIDLGLRDGTLESVLKNEPLLCETGEPIRYIFETTENGILINDVSVSFSQKHRRYNYRMYKEVIEKRMEHDPMSEL